MATLPPRKNPTPTKISKQHLTPLQTLLQLGFPKHRAEKALAATGHRGARLASDWLLAHVGDPTLDTVTQRQYILYACPTGSFAERLLTFWAESKEIGWNGAHNFVPHITLVSFFKAPDELAETLVNTLEDIIRGKVCDSVELETYVSANFMGFFVKESSIEQLKNIAVHFVEKLAALGISAEPQVKSFHLTLAYQFPNSSFQSLRSMVEDLELTTPADWEIRLYSRDSRLQNSHVHKVMHGHMPREQDELELRVGDYIYIPEGACNASVDGWVEGVSWLTGTSGHLPLNHTKRTAESDSWTLHAAVRITSNKIRTSEEEEDVEEEEDEEEEEGRNISRVPKSALLSTNNSVDVTDGIAIDDEPMEASRAPSLPSREIFICRHGERVDFTFGTWIPYCFEVNGQYIRRDLNMPKQIPSRNIQDFQNDSPLTTIGEVQANLVGEAMKSSEIKIDVAFSSPSLRCIQTLAHMLKGLGLNIPIKVEPGLIEWLAWYPNGIPTWMTSEELAKAGFNVDKNYQPFVKTKDLPVKENAAQYYERSYDLIKRIIENTVGNILIVAHAASLAACTRQLTGGRIPPAAEITRLVQRVPYLACLTAREEIDGWQLYPPPFPPITHASNNRFDWKDLM